MKKIGILYICTGNYSVFWEDFYKTFEQFFCKKSEIHYFVFSDKIMQFDENERIHFHQIQNFPWPLVTLFRFHTFLSIIDELKKMDYLFFFNSNMICNTEISEEEFLPNSEEKLLFVRHPGYCYTHRLYIPYDRNKKCTAYIPYKSGGTYVIGAVEGGETEAFLDMCQTLKNNIEKDLKKNVIAKWHDESHINHYIYTVKKYKILDPGFCYPVGFDLPFERKISGVSKQDKFDVKSFKTVEEKKSFIQKLLYRFQFRIMPIFGYIKSIICFERIK